MTGSKDYVGIRRCLEGGMSLGELEAEILDVVWDLEPPVTTTQVHKVIYGRRELSYSTIMLTMAKLARKGLLDASRKGERKTDPFFYTPVVSRMEMGLSILQQVSLQVTKKSLPDLVGMLISGDGISDQEVKKVTAVLQKAIRK